MTTYMKFYQHAEFCRKAYFLLGSGIAWYIQHRLRFLYMKLENVELNDTL